MPIARGKATKSRLRSALKQKTDDPGLVAAKAVICCVQHGNITPLRNLLAELPKSCREDFKSWILAKAPVVWNKETKQLDAMPKHQRAAHLKKYNADKVKFASALRADPLRKLHKRSAGRSSLAIDIQSVTTNMEAIVEGLESRPLLDTIQQWRSALRLLQDETAPASHAKALLLVDAIRAEWRRRAESPNPEDWFAWPHTDASGEGSGDVNSSGWIAKGVLKHVGYSVGRTVGVPLNVRTSILSQLFEGPIPPMFPPEYLEQWGSPAHASRLKKLADSLASFARNAKYRKSHDLSCAIRDWEDDLEYLFDKYYVGHFRFAWPSTLS